MKSCNLIGQLNHCNSLITSVITPVIYVVVQCHAFSTILELDLARLRLTKAASLNVMGRCVFGTISESDSALESPQT